MRALLVEVSSDNVERIRLELSRHGFQVLETVTRTRAEFLAAVKEGPWDVVLSGHSMKGLDPTDALQLLREHDADTPFMVVSGAIGEDGLGPAVERELREAANRRMQRSTQDALQAWKIARGTRNAPKP